MSHCAYCGIALANESHTYCELCYWAIIAAVTAPKCCSSCGCVVDQSLGCLETTVDEVTYRLCQVCYALAEVEYDCAVKAIKSAMGL